MSRMLFGVFGLFLLALCSPLAAFAHTSSDSFLTLRIEKQTVRGEFAVAVRDLEYALGLDQNGDGSITWGELQQKQREIEQLVFSHILLSVPGQRCPLTATEMLVEKRGDGSYVFFNLTGSCEKALTDGVPITVEYSLFFETNPQHRGLANLQLGPNPRVFVFSPESRRVILSKEPGESGPSSLLQFFVEGVWHIWTGYDHILFLLSLLFPAVLLRREGRWEPAPSFKAAFVAVLKVVTAFTIAHSITLALAAMQVVHLPSRIVETTIAFSVFLAAANNIVHAVEERRLWWVAFAFGLIHGFGFAGVMREFGLQGTLLLTSVLTFNLGVEAGQLVIVLCFLPFAFFIRRSWFYRTVILTGGSLATAGLALHWMTERFLGN